MYSHTVQLFHHIPCHVIKIDMFDGTGIKNKTWKPSLTELQLPGLHVPVNLEMFAKYFVMKSL